MTNLTHAAPRERLSGALSKLWWILSIRGILLVLVGAYALFRPEMTAVALSQLIGFFVIADGILAVVAAILGETPSRLWTFLRGVLVILVGLFVFGHSVVVSGVTATVVLSVVALGIIASGVLEIYAAIRDRKGIEGEGSQILGGVLAVAFGLLMLIAPIAFGLAIVRILGVCALIFGMILIMLAIRARKFGKALKE